MIGFGATTGFGSMMGFVSTIGFGSMTGVGSTIGFGSMIGFGSTIVSILGSRAFGISRLTVVFSVTFGLKAPPPIVSFESFASRSGI